jgi:phage terminase large subunit-like protein
VAFFERYFTHAKGELGGKPFALEPWQRDYVRALFAEENGQRKIRTSLLALPRKNGKSSLCAGIALRLLLEDEPGCEVYSCAASRDQARLVFDMARIAVEQSPILSQHLTVYRSAIVRDKTHGTYKALSAEAGIQHGLSAHGVIFDELHVSNREMWEVMLSSQGARRQPLTVALTTAGYDRKSVCWEVWQYAEAVKAGSIKDATFLPAIYAVRAEINELTEKYNIRQLGIDRWNATQLSLQLQGDGIDVVGFGQGYGSMSAPSKQLEAMVVSAKLLHNNPVLDWQAGNVAIQQDHAGNIKPSKQKSTERIDGIVSLVMALGIMATATTKPEANWDIIEL